MNKNYYQVLDVGFNANPETIRTAYIRAKNAYTRDSLATYSLFDADDSKKIISEIEEAYSILSDAEKRKHYDEAHGYLSSDTSHYYPSTFNVNKSEKSAGGATSPLERLAAQSNNASTTNLRSYKLKKQYTENPEMESLLKNPAEVNGVFLKRAREYKSVTIEELMELLKISKNYLMALEEDAVEKLPANVFVRGFVIQYAKLLELDHETIASRYMDFLKARRP